jgi:acyl transferase domain-containing protein
MSEDEAAEFLEQTKERGVTGTAYINSPQNVTLSSNASMIVKLQKDICITGCFTQSLQVSTAYHSLLMRDMVEKCLMNMVGARLMEPREIGILMLSSVTGDLINHQQVRASYWTGNM